MLELLDKLVASFLNNPDSYCFLWEDFTLLLLTSVYGQFLIWDINQYILHGDILILDNSQVKLDKTATDNYLNGYITI